MAKPPGTPPSSDIDGVNEDRERIDQPANSAARPNEQLKQQKAETRGRPPGGGG